MKTYVESKYSLYLIERTLQAMRSSKLEVRLSETLSRIRRYRKKPANLSQWDCGAQDAFYETLFDEYSILKSAYKLKYRNDATLLRQTFEKVFEKVIDIDDASDHIAGYDVSSGDPIYR